MIKNFDEVPDTIEALKFYIMAGENSVKQLRNKANKLNELVSEAKRRLEVKQNSLNQ